jgi:predicted nicotinamide N-methyase
MQHGHATGGGGGGGGGGSGGLLAQLHAERVARQPARETMHDLDGSTAVAIVEQHGAQLGSSLWHSALPLCDWLYSSSHLWGDRSRSHRILELGAGCGTCGIAAALAPPGGHTVVLTDKAEVCDHLQRNAVVNTAVIQATGSSVHVAPLLWRRTLQQNEAWAEWEAVKQHGPFDVIIACECVYELPLLAALIDTIAHGAAEYARTTEAGRARASAAATTDDFCVIVLGFCRRGGSLCPPEAVEEMLLERFEHVSPPSALSRDIGKHPSGDGHDSSSGTDTGTTFIYQMKLRGTTAPEQ